MKSRSIALIVLLVLSTCAFAASKPHIVLVMADDQGWGDMGYYGHPRLKTPNFDKAAATGLRFDRFYAAAPVCSPTRASVLTGRHPNRMGVFKWGYPMRPQEVTIAEALKTAGYATAHFGKWHLGSVRNNSPASPGANGFDEWYSAENFYDNDSILSRKGRAVPGKGESSFIAVDAALDWMKETLAEDAPIFAVVWFGSPHGPHRAVDEDRAHYRDLSEKLQHFYGEITGMDRAFGKLRDSLDDLGIRENTLLWYCSDNGALPGVGNTGGHRGNKGKVYDGGLLVPAILEWPARIKQHRTTDMRCNTTDIFPTLLDIVGIPAPDDRPIDGRSLVPLIDGLSTDTTRTMGFWDKLARGIGTPSDAWMDELYAAQQAGGDLEPQAVSVNAARLPDPKHPLDRFPGHAAWIDGDWKLHRIEGDNGNLRWELYDLGADPKEKTDLASHESERVGRMREGMNAWLESVARSLNGDDY